MLRLLLLFVVFSCFLAPARSEQVVISEIMYHPAGTEPEYIEVWNISHTPIDFAHWKFSEGVSYTFPDFDAGAAQAAFLRPLERIVISAADPAATRAAYGIPAAVRVFGPWTGNLDNGGERVTLNDKNGVPVCSVKYGDGGRWPKAADGAGHSLVLRNENNPIDSFHNWRQSRVRNGTPGSTEFTSVEAFSNPETAAGAGAVLVDYDATWKFLIPASDPGTTWQDPAFDDSSWGSGPGLLGFETAALPAPGIQTPVNGSASGSITYLFRKKFTYNGDPTGVSYAIDQIVDDGVAYYLNGQPLGSVGYSPGGLWNQTASRSVGDATEELDAVTGAATALVQGENTLTAEAHQINTTSSDLVFGARFKLSAPATVLINEVKPGAAGQGFVEFFNVTGTPVDLNGYYLSDSAANLTKFQIASSLTVPANSFASIGFAESNLAVAATTGVYLTAPDGVTVINAIVAAMPIDGRSLGRDPAGSTSWFLFSTPTPDAPNSGGGEGSEFSVRLSEIHFAANGAANGAVDWVEVENHGTATQPLAGLGLASLTDFSDKVALTGSVPAGGFASFPVDFTPDASGDIVLYLVDSQNSVLGTAEVTRVAGRPSLQAVHAALPPTLPSWETPKRQAEWYASVNDTRDAANAPDITTAIVINEIMCDPPSGQKADEFIELYNRAGAPVSLDGWKIRGGVDLDFPSGTSIPAGGYLVVASSKSTIHAHYPNATVVGDWSGALGSSGDLIRLIDGAGNLADEVDYKVGGDWPTLANGLGSSLELINPDMDNSRASAWRDSDESNKTAFQTFTTTGTYRQLNSAGSPTDYKELHLFMAGDAHCIVRNVTLRQNGTGTNVINNPTSFSTNGSSATGWLCQGTHWASFMDGTELHLVSDGHGDNRPNRAEIDATGLTQNASYTLEFEARWVWGKPRLIAQTWDHTVGSPFLLPVPNDLGTPGAANSAAQPAPTAQVDSLLHQPAVPSSSDPVVVTARVASATPLTSVQVFHRQSSQTNSNNFTPEPMFDDGTHGDAVGGDGLYSATITAYQINSTPIIPIVVEFYVNAASAGGTSTIPRQGADRPALWIVDNRNLDNRLRFQRFIVPLYDRAALNTSVGQSANLGFDFPRLSNHYFNATFIHNETDIYYNAEIRKSGSPWTRSDTNELDRGKWKVPHDRIFRNRDKSTFDNDAANSTSRFHNRLVRYWLYVLGHPVNENEFVTQVINADNPALREDTEPVDGALIGRNFPKGNQGQLMRSDDEWWFQDNWNRNNRDADWSYKGTDEAIRYHTEWITRSREAEYDYSSLTEFFKTVSSGASTREQLDRVIDPGLTLMVAAVRGFAGDWDSFTLNRGKNGFFYRKPTDGRWMFLHWDSDLAFQSTTEIVVGSRAGWGTYISKAWNRRTFNYYLTEMLNLTTGSKAARTQAFFAAEEAASTAYNVNVSFYQSFFSGRQNSVRTEINKSVGGGPGGSLSAPFTSTGSGGSTASDTGDITGTAPSSGFTIVVEGHPEAVFEWVNQTKWTISGLILATGSNEFVLRLVDAEGNVIGTINHTIVKTGNASPAMVLEVNPGSYNAALGETVVLDASDSFDPDGGSLNYVWQQSPATDVTISHPTPAVSVATIHRPGVYSFTATGTNSAAGSSAITREITAYHSTDFSSFGTKSLEPFWAVSGVEILDSYSATAWYSLEETSGHLAVQVLDDEARPLAFSNPTHPLFLRPLPASGDFAVQTDVTLEARRTGGFQTGLYLEMMQSGVPVRYAFGIDNGTLITVKSSNGDAFSNVSDGQGTYSAPFSDVDAKLRIWRVGNELRFQRRQGGVWTTVGRAVQLPAGATAANGGVFLATSTAQSVRVAFDYFLLADSSHVASLAGQVRITELMYHPVDPGTVEFIELQNTGTTTVNLQGLNFDDGRPFGAFTFGNTPLPAGGYAVITNSGAAFQAKYGFAPTAEWPMGGGLSNGGERITLRDDTGAIIHDFTYNNSTPWPTDPDGQGPSLVVIDPFGDYDDPSNWRASFEIGGSPGGIGSGGDSDGDGQPDDWEVLFGTDPHDPNSRFVVSTGVNGSGQPTIGFPTAAGVDYRIDYTNSLMPVDWHELTTVPGTGNPVSIADPTTPPPTQRFYRVTPVP